MVDTFYSLDSFARVKLQTSHVTNAKLLSSHDGKDYISVKREDKLWDIIKLESNETT